jgi:hypothetical protein
MSDKRQLIYLHYSLVRNPEACSVSQDTRSMCAACVISLVPLRRRALPGYGSVPELTMSSEPSRPPLFRKNV